MTLRDYGLSRVSFRWLGLIKTVPDARIQHVAELWHVTPEVLKIKKQLIKTDLPEYRNLSRLRNEIRRYWVSRTLLTLEDGYRLLRKQHFAQFSEQMLRFGAEWDVAVQDLENVWDRVIQDIRPQLGDLFDPADYHSRPIQIFRFHWTITERLPPVLSIAIQQQYTEEQLLRLQQELNHRVQAEAEATLAAIRQAVLGEMKEIVEHIVDRLSPDPRTGAQKRFRNSTITKLSDFVSRIQEIASGLLTDAHLQQLLEQAQQLLSGVSPEEVRESHVVAQELREKVSQFKAVLDREYELATESARKLWL